MSKTRTLRLALGEMCIVEASPFWLVLRLILFGLFQLLFDDVERLDWEEVMIAARQMRRGDQSEIADATFGRQLAELGEALGAAVATITKLLMAGKGKGTKREMRAIRKETKELSTLRVRASVACLNVPRA